MRPLDDSTNGREESAYVPISELEFSQLKDQYVRELDEADRYEQRIRAAREAFEASIVEIRAKKAQHEASADELKVRLIEQARLNYQSSGNKTFAGVQYRETKKIKYDDATRALLEDSLQFEEYKGKPVVKTVLKVDDSVLKQWVEQRQNMNLPVPPGVEITIEPTIALIKDK